MSTDFATLGRMEFKEALKHYGSRNKIAKALGINRQAITRWADSGIPELRQYELEALTDGKLKRNGRGSHKAGRGNGKGA